MKSENIAYLIVGGAATVIIRYGYLVIRALWMNFQLSREARRGRASTIVTRI